MDENNKFTPSAKQEVCKDPIFTGFFGYVFATYTAENPDELHNKDNFTCKMTEEHVAQVLSIPLEWLGLTDEVLESCHQHGKYTLLSLFNISTIYGREIFNNDKTLIWICALLRHLTGYLPITQGVLDRIDHYNNLCKDNLDRIKSHMVLPIY